MSQGRYEVVGRLPPGQGTKTSLAMTGGGAVSFRKMAVLRPVGDATLIPVANVHPKLPAPLSVENIDGADYVVYDFFPGATLKEIRDIFRAQEQLPPLGLVVRIVADAAKILQAAHEHTDPLGATGAFVHGGVADSSLLMGFDGEVRVIDFGLRKFNRFASPEAAHGTAIDGRADVFSLAAALHSALTGFEKDYAPILSKAPGPEQFPPPSSVHPDATAELDALLMKAMYPDAASRVTSAAELAAELERICGALLPPPQDGAVQLKEIFHERLEGFKHMVPKVGEAPASSAPRPRVSRPSLPPVESSGPVPQEAAPPPRVSRPSLTKPQPEPGDAGTLRASRPAITAQTLDTDGAGTPRPPGAEGPTPEPLPSAPRKSGARNKTIPKGTQPDGRRDTPAEVKAAFGDPDGVEAEATVVAPADSPLHAPPRPTTKMDVDTTRPDRPTVLDLSKEIPPARKHRPSGERKALKRPSADLPDVPWEPRPELPGEGPRDSMVTDERDSLAATGDVPTGAAMSAERSGVGAIPPSADEIADVPTGVSKRVTGSHSKLQPAGSRPEEKARAVGQELVQTGDLDPDEAEDLRNLPTQVRLSGTHKKLIVDGAEEGPLDEDAVKAAFGNIAEGEEPDQGTAILERGEPLGDKPALGTGQVAPSTGMLVDPLAAKKKKSGGGGGPRKVIALMLVVMSAGFGYLAVKNPVLMRAKITAALVKWGLKPPPPPPQEPVEPPPGEPEVALLPDGGAAPAVAMFDEDGGFEEDADGGEEEEEDDDGGVASLDAGHHPDGGAIHKVKKKKKKRRGSKAWWQTK